MGYKRDFYSRRDYKRTTKAVSGIIAGLIVAPFAIAEAASKLNPPTYSNTYIPKPKKVKVNTQQPIKAHKKLLNTLSQVNSSTMVGYSQYIKSSTTINQEIAELNTDIVKYKTFLKLFGFFPRLKQKLFQDIRTAYREINSLNRFNKVPIALSCPRVELKGYIYLDLNNKINAGKQICIDKLAHKKGKPHLFYSINRVPSTSLHFENIELYFFDDAIIFMTKDDYVVIDKESIFVEYRIIPIEASLLNKDEKQFNILDTHCRHFCKDGTIDLRYVNYRMIELGVIELRISEQKINLLFSNIDCGKQFYNLLKQSFRLY